MAKRYEKTENTRLLVLSALFLAVGVVLPSLTGSILEGVTRRSVLQLVADRGIEVHEHTITLDEAPETFATLASKKDKSIKTIIVFD